MEFRLPQDDSGDEMLLFASAEKILVDPESDLCVMPDSDDGLDVGELLEASVRNEVCHTARPLKRPRQKNVVSGRFPFYHDGLKRNDFIDAIPQLACDDLPTHVGMRVPSQRDDFWELFSPPRVCPFIEKLGFRAPISVDLKTGWDLLDASHQYRFALDLASQQPRTLMVSPPCTMFSILMPSNWWRMPKGKREKRAVNACRLLDFAVWICQTQHERGAFMCLNILQQPVLGIGKICRISLAKQWIFICVALVFELPVVGLCASPRD